jgi:ABC-type xylose transport system permease subunit
MLISRNINPFFFFFFLTPPTLPQFLRVIFIATSSYILLSYYSLLLFILTRLNILFIYFYKLKGREAENLGKSSWKKKSLKGVATCTSKDFFRVKVAQKLCIYALEIFKLALFLSLRFLLKRQQQGRLICLIGWHRTVCIYPMVGGHSLIEL